MVLISAELVQEAEGRMTASDLKNAKPGFDLLSIPAHDQCLVEARLPRLDQAEHVGQGRQTLRVFLADDHDVPATGSTSLQ